MCGKAPVRDPEIRRLVRHHHRRVSSAEIDQMDAMLARGRQRSRAPVRPITATSSGRGGGRAPEPPRPPLVDLRRCLQHTLPRARAWAHLACGRLHPREG
ncbi:hypothetical protein ACRAWD_20685 [Caulobacter segnis]